MYQSKKRGQSPAFKGEDTNGVQYKSLDDMWQKELGDQNKQLKKEIIDENVVVGSKENWYKKAADVWESKEATVKGVLGGFPELHDIDLVESFEFLNQYVNTGMINNGTAIDCGAGIGRITKFLLANKFKKVDMVEQNPLYVEKAKTYIDKPSIDRYFCAGLQDFTPDQGYYDCIWIQWVIEHLTDEDLVAFLERCKAGITDSGIIIVKENTACEGFVVDKEYTSVIRSAAIFEHIFQKAGLKILNKQYQKQYPEDLYRVIMYSLVPQKRNLEAKVQSIGNTTTAKN
eukprot:CAMPEP_0114985742 /NCGR_PEP_ID=MMETSP0216-20121206/8038_1 /TAXON_ID=223996 /ORGANISM="Protocruzia adherens, Strain Boccale" /LENGTH=286 /DNA_ID=CAMNT_0002348097 /DNA_START=234 /DNA_END=1094 /DNA_ORIENTATION=+